jgi:hypothetical protein
MAGRTVLFRSAWAKSTLLNAAPQEAQLPQIFDESEEEPLNPHLVDYWRRSLSIQA